MSRHRSIPGRPLPAALVLLAAIVATPAGELALSWPPNRDELTAGYDVELLDADGRSIRTIDVGEATSVVLHDLEDGRRYGVRVRPYDRWGQRAREATRTLVTMPLPRVDAIDGRLRAGRWTYLEVFGANYDDGAEVLIDLPDVETGTVTVIDPTHLLVEVRTASGGPAPEPEQVHVFNPVRRASDFFDAHPELLDVDRNGRIDRTDLQVIEDLFGTGRDDPGYLARFDPNGDGLIDGEDAALIERRLRAVRSAPRLVRAP